MNAATPERRPATEEISGVIERVTFHNDDSVFCVLRVKTPGRPSPRPPLPRARPRPAAHAHHYYQVVTCLAHFARRACGITKSKTPVGFSHP